MSHVMFPFPTCVHPLCEVVRETLRLWPRRLIVGQRVRLELRLVRGHQFFTAILALHPNRKRQPYKFFQRLAL